MEIEPCLAIDFAIKDILFPKSMLWVFGTYFWDARYQTRKAYKL